MNDSFSYRHSGIGYEILGPDGSVIAWTVVAAWAALIIGLLNFTEQNGLWAVTLSQDSPLFGADEEIYDYDQT